MKIIITIILGILMYAAYATVVYFIFSRYFWNTKKYCGRDLEEQREVVTYVWPLALCYIIGKYIILYVAIKPTRFVLKKLFN